jgi:hypothetical protein
MDEIGRLKNPQVKFRCCDEIKGSRVFLRELQRAQGLSDEIRDDLALQDAAIQVGLYAEAMTAGRIHRGDSVIASDTA